MQELLLTRRLGHIRALTIDRQPVKWVRRGEFQELKELEGKEGERMYENEQCNIHVTYVNDFTYIMNKDLMLP